MKYKYKTKYIKFNELEKQLNKISNKGWDTVSVCPSEMIYLVVFKKAIEATEDEEYEIGVANG